MGLRGKRLLSKGYDLDDLSAGVPKIGRRSFDDLDGVSSYEEGYVGAGSTARP